MASSSRGRGGDDDGDGRTASTSSSSCHVVSSGDVGTNAGKTRPRRLAEKPRVSTCAFADRVATCVLEECRRLGALPPTRADGSGMMNTVIAAFVAVNVARDVREEDVDTQTGPHTQQQWERQRRMRVVALGKGTKVCSHRVISANTDGRRVHDMHAEVLARRSLMRVLYAEILAGGGDLLERVSRPSEYCLDGEDACAAIFRRRRDVSLHMYISSAPCGNATLKRWAKSKKEVFLDELDAWTWPTCVPSSTPSPSEKEEADERQRAPSTSSGRRKDMCHESDAFTAFAAREGQVAALVKRDPDVAMLKKHAAQLAHTAGEDEEDALRRSRLGALRTEYQRSPLALSSAATAVAGGDVAKLEAVLCNRNIVPAGTSIPGLREGCMLTCSDKLAVWNCLGLQGALLARFIAEPVIVDTITVGRKFSQAHMRRAVCCRMAAFDDLMASNRMLSPERRGRQRWAFGHPNGGDWERRARMLRVNHPTLMCTSVMLDDGDVDRDESANFESAFGEAWSDGDGPQMEAIDAGTGMVGAGAADKLAPASVSKSSLFESYREAVRVLGARMLHASPPCADESFIGAYIAEKRAAAAWHHEARCVIHASCNKLFDPGKDWPRPGFVRKQEYFWLPSKTGV